jgi:hypothetical protein
MTKQNKILTGIIAGALAIGGGVAVVSNLNTTTEPTIKHYPIKNMLGVNIHEWDIMVSDPDFNNNQQRTDSLQKAIIDLGVTGLRLYADAGAMKTDDNTQYQFSPNRRGWRIDSGLLMLRKANPNLTVLYCYQGSPNNINNEYNNVSEKNTIYVHRADDRLNPASYREEGHDLAVLAGRGGRNPNVPDYPILVPNNTWETRGTMYKGANIYDLLEPTNEPDNNWMNTRFFKGAEMAAMAKGVYDSIKKVDPTMIVSSPGMASDDTIYLSQAIQWCNTNNGGKIPFDEYQFHSYGSGMWQYNNNIANGIPPEESTIKAAKKMVPFAASHGITTFVGEHSYDQHPYSWIGITPISNYTPSERVAYWGLREVLGYAVTGVKRAFYYKLYQDWNTDADSSEGLFATSSLLVQQKNGHIQRRLIGDVFKQLHQVGDFVYDRTIIDNDTVKMYVFKNGTQELYTGWTVEQIGTTYDRGNRTKFTERFYNYNLNVSGTRLDINEDSSGVFKQSAFTAGNVKLSSKPFFVLVGGTVPPPPPPAPTPDSAWIYTGRKGYWILNSKRVYYKVYQTSGSYQIKTGDYKWYQLP